MARRELSSKLIPKTYAELRDAVLAVVGAGRRAIDRAWVESYHEIGRLIHEHLLFKEERAPYGARVYADLAEESGISKRVLYECVQFFRYFPIVRGHAQLGRTHYQLLCQVADAKRREALLRAAIKKRWTPDELRPRVRTTNAGAIETNGRDAADVTVPPPQLELLKPSGGTAGLHLIVARSDGLAIDLGFKLYWPLTTEQTKRFTDSLLAPGQAVTVNTTKPDKYDRYLADVFVPAKTGEPVFLNNALLETGHAVRKKAWEFGDWGM